MTPEVSIIIPNWNGRHLLEDCLNSLDKQSYKNFQVIVVDNNSSDGSIDWIDKNFPLIKVISLDKNYGFAFACNIGAKSVESKYLIFLNNDTEVEKNWVSYLVKTIRQHESSGVASVGSKLLNFYNRSTIDGVGIEINEVGQAKSVGWNETDIGQFDSQTTVFGVTGGASLFNREIFIKVGLFDEDYFMYSEEVDWAFRAQFLGYKALYCPKAVVYHKHKSSSKKMPQHLEYWQFRNMFQTIIKDFPTSVIFKNRRWLKMMLVYLNTHLYQFKNGYFWPPLKTDLWLLFHVNKLLKKRAAIQKSKKVSDDYIEQFLNPKKITLWGLLK